MKKFKKGQDVYEVRSEKYYGGIRCEVVRLTIEHVRKNGEMLVQDHYGESKIVNMRAVYLTPEEAVIGKQFREHRIEIADLKDGNRTMKQGINQVKSLIAAWGVVIVGSVVLVASLLLS